METERKPRQSRISQSNNYELLETLNEKLAPFEQPKKFRLLPKDFELSEGEVTPTMKIRRRVIEKKYEKMIDEIYGE